jgi:hypothetical protein
MSFKLQQKAELTTDSVADFQIRVGVFADGDNVSSALCSQCQMFGLWSA